MSREANYGTGGALSAATVRSVCSVYQPCEKIKRSYLINLVQI